MMKKLLLILLFASFSAHSQTVLLSEGFESYQDFTITNFGQWTVLDLDKLATGTLGGSQEAGWVPNWPNAGSPMAFQIFNPSKANVTNNTFATDPTQEQRNFDPHSGSKYAGSWFGYMQANGQGNQDWLISPSITLGSGGNKLSFWVKTLSPSYGDERYVVGVYTGSGTPTTTADFKIISALPYSYAAGQGSWNLVSFNLDQFAGQKIRFGIEDLTQEGSMLMVDDVLVTTTGAVLGTNETTDDASDVYPNPVQDILFIKNNKISAAEVFDMTGKLIKSLQVKNEKISLSELPAGSYLIKLKDINGNANLRKIQKK